VRSLLNAGAAPNYSCDGDGHYPLDYASVGNQEAMYILLRTFGAQFKRVPERLYGCSPAVIEALPYPAFRTAVVFHKHRDARAALRVGRIDPDACAGALAPLFAAAEGCAATKALANMALRGWSPAHHWLHGPTLREAAHATMLCFARIRRCNFAEGTPSCAAEVLPAEAAALLRQVRQRPPTAARSSVVPRAASGVDGGGVGGVGGGLPSLPPELWTYIISFFLRRHFREPYTSQNHMYPGGNDPNSPIFQQDLYV
jgi:hypothetical protein